MVGERCDDQTIDKSSDQSKYPQDHLEEAHVQTVNERDQSIRNGSNDKIELDGEKLKLDNESDNEDGDSLYPDTSMQLQFVSGDTYDLLLYYITLMLK